MSTLHELERETGLDLATNDYWAQARLRLIREWVDERHPVDVLDVGCGSGYLASELANEYRHVVGIDIDTKLIEVARRRETPAEFEIGDARDIKYPDDAFDVVLLADIVEHFEDPGPVFAEARRVCRPDGHVIVSTPAHKWLYGPHDANQGHARRYTASLLAEHGESAGLAPVRKRYTNTIPLLPYAFMQKVLRRDVPSGVRGGSGSRLIDMAKSALLKTERVLGAYPVGVTLIGEFTPAKAGDASPSVLMTNYEYPPGCGGGGVFTHDLREQLRSDGHEIPLVAGQNRSAWMQNGVFNLATWPFRNWMALRREIRKTDPDLVHGHFTLPSSLMLPLIKQEFGIPYVVSVIGADMHDPTRYHRIRPAMDVLNDRWVLEHAGAVTTASSDMYFRVPEHHREKTTVIPYFVDVDEYQPGPDHPTIEYPVNLLSVARLVPRKNLEVAIETLAALLEDERKATLTIVGDGSQRSTLEAHANKLGVTRAVDFTGYVDGAELVQTYQDHDVFILPSHHEGFGIVFLEAIACGLPVLGSDIGGQRDIITHDVGGVASPDSPEAFAAGVTHIVSDYEHYARNARQRAIENYSAPVVSEQYRELYTSITNENGE